MPSFNQGKFLEEGILSVLGQNYPDLEFIVIDGGSTDHSCEILENYSKQLTYWHSRKDKGQADAIRQGVSRSTGEVLCWLNSDDMLLPGALRDIGSRFVAPGSGKYRLIYGAAVTIYQENTNLNCTEQVPLLFDSELLTYFDYIIQPSSFWTRELWDAAGGIDIGHHYVLDWDFYIKASKITAFEYVPKFYSVYRRHPLHKSGQGSAARRREIVNIVRQRSTPYWTALYEAVENRYEKVKFLFRCCDYLGLPRCPWLLPVFFPGILKQLKKPGDLKIVIEMLR